jgi:hypothetical protein
METSLFRESLTNAIRYWEKMRLVYNAVLILVVAVCFSVNYSTAKAEFTVRTQYTVQLVLFMILLAVLANVLYCTAYVVDVVVQMSGYRERWVRNRWVLFSIGLAAASILTYFLSTGLFGSHNF